MLLRVNKLNVKYGSSIALTDVMLEVKAGEIVSIIGSNGSGKTTLVKSIFRLLDPVSGTIYFNKIDCLSLPPHKIPPLGIALVPEGRRIFPYMTVKENLMMGAYVLSGNKSLIESNLAHIEQLFPILKEKHGQQAKSLSGGQQQQLAIGRALMSNPKLLVLDEPSLGLDPKTVERVYASIKEINNEGTTILLIEQRVDKAFEISKRTYVLAEGVVVKKGKSSELAQDPFIQKVYLGL